MAHLGIDIDEVVRRVMAELGLARPERPSSAPPPCPAPSPAATPPAAASDGQGSGELALTSRVVTLAEVRDSLSGVARLVVPLGAVVTPAVRDELHRRNIVLAFESAVAQPRATGLRLLMMVHGSGFDPAPLAAAIRAEGVELDQRQNDCVIRSVDELAGELAAANTLGLMATAYPAAALCLANRHRNLRPVWAIDAGRLAADAASIGANMLVVDPTWTGPYQMKQLVTQFLRIGPAECPKALRGRLT